MCYPTGNFFYIQAISMTWRLKSLEAVMSSSLLTCRDLALPVPVQLVLVYRDVDNPSARPDRKTTLAAYTNTDEIRHIEFASQVQFEHFTLEVGLFSEGVRGPLVTAQGEFSKGHHSFVC